MTEPPTLILDVDGVIRHWDAEGLEAASIDLGLPPGALFEAASDDALIERAITGVITDEEWKAEIARRCAARCDVDAERLATLWTAGRRWSIDRAVLDMVQAVRSRGGRVALFSNATTGLEADMLECGVAEAVDDIVNSARLGLAKPDPAAFTAAAMLLGVNPSACVFVDDRESNVAGAREAGMRAEVYAGAAELHALLTKVGLL